jgi:hypothetical protein
MHIQGYEQLVEKMKKMKKNALAFLFIIGCFTLFGQSSIRGLVTDQATGETLPGVKITLEGTQKITLTDFDGKFNFNGIPEGNYSITAKYATYTTKTITDVGVKTGEPTVLNIAMGSAVSEQQEVVVTATMKKESNSALLLAQKNATTVSDGISAESIKRTPDRSTSDVLKRISGASIQDNKFAVIRGLNDRYNAAYINGAPLPSSESDRKAFSFDIFPANMLDNLVIIKTATPELPAEFAGGIIQVNTKSIPEDNFQSLSIGGGYNTITTGKEKMSYKGGKLDWLGIDDGSRAMPKGIPATKFDQKLGAELAKNNVTDWTSSYEKQKPNMSFQYSIGRNKELKNMKLGMVGAINYNNNTVFNTMTENRYDAFASTLPDSKFINEIATNQTLFGTLLNLSLKLNENHQLSSKNLYSINSDDRFILKTGKLEGDSVIQTARWFTSNQIFTSQLTGNHYFPTPKIKLNWVGSIGTVRRDIPNLRRTRAIKTEDGEYQELVLSAGNTISDEYSGNSFNATNLETIKSFKADVNYQFQIGKHLKNEVKSGIFVQGRNRDFKARQLQYFTKNQDLQKLNYNELFTAQNMGEDKLYFIDGFKQEDSYKASSFLSAGYLQLDQKIKNIRLIWGARAENYAQTLNTFKLGKPLDIVYPTVLDLLPSANFIYSINEKQNVRLSYSKTINRPEFRELAPFLFYDFTNGMSTNGNDTLVRARIDNLDFRYEIYPGKGQMFSVSVFNKNFERPIEPTLFGNDVTIVYRNAKKAQNYGMELEFRTNLASLLPVDSANVLDDFTLFSNIAIIRSKIDVDSTSRPLQGQSPYIFNGGISYQNEKHAFSVSLSANRVGERIYIVGQALTEGGKIYYNHIWENSRTFLDLQLTKKLLKKKLELKLNIQNILAQNQVFYQNGITNERTGNETLNQLVFGNKDNLDGYNADKDRKIWNMNFGRVFSFSAAYNF